MKKAILFSILCSILLLVLLPMTLGLSDLPQGEIEEPIDKTPYENITTCIFTGTHSDVPILMYHVIEEFTGTHEELYVSPAAFKSQLAYLKAQGFEAVTVRDVLLHWENGAPLPNKPVVLTFDDGYRSVYQNAFPLLKEYGYTATLYPYLAKIDTPQGLSVMMIKEMADYGLEIGSHTLTHPDLRKLNASMLAKQVQESKERLSTLTGTEVTTFCYPAGRYNALVVDQVKSAGYLGAVTTHYGFASTTQNPFMLKRIRINKSDTLNSFAVKLTP